MPHIKRDKRILGTIPMSFPVVRVRAAEKLMEIEVSHWVINSKQKEHKEDN